MEVPDYDDWTVEDRESFDQIAAEAGLSGRELWQRIKTKETPLSQWGDEYLNVLAKIAASAGTSSERLHREISARIETNHVGSNCLTLAEIELLVAGTPLRQSHIDNCDFCKDLTDVMNLNNPKGERQFVEVALKTVHDQKP